MKFFPNVVFFTHEKKSNIQGHKLHNDYVELSATEREKVLKTLTETYTLWKSRCLPVQLPCASWMYWLITYTAQVGIWPIPPYGIVFKSGMFFGALPSGEPFFLLSTNSLFHLCWMIVWVIWTECCCLNWNHMRVNFAVCFGSLSCWKVQSHFIFIILVDGCRFHLKNFPILGPFIVFSIVWRLLVAQKEKHIHATVGIEILVTCIAISTPNVCNTTP